MVTPPVLIESPTSKYNCSSFARIPYERLILFQPIAVIPRVEHHTAHLGLPYSFIQHRNLRSATAYGYLILFTELNDCIALSADQHILQYLLDGP
jgi:hypothetical protein